MQIHWERWLRFYLHRLLLGPWSPLTIWNVQCNQALNMSSQLDPTGTGTKNTKRRLYKAEKETQQVFLDLAYFWEEFNLQMYKVSISSKFSFFFCFCCCVLWSELVRVDPSWSGPTFVPAYLEWLLLISWNSAQ